MKNIHRTFSVIELGKSAASTDIELLMNDTVEVTDLTTRAVLHIKASDVSIYRHTLHWHGKSFNITNIRESI